VYLEFDARPGTASLEIMESEARKLIEPSGVSLDWRLLRDNRGDETFNRLVVLRFKGSCQADSAPSAGSDFGTLGEVRSLASTRVVDGDVTPYGEVECDEVRQALSYLAPGATSDERRTALGVALGRVVAHELYHMLARTVHHAAEGLGKSAQCLADLVSSRSPAFQDSDRRAMMRGFLAPVKKTKGRY
jgi:hypothetical protein